MSIASVDLSRRRNRAQAALIRVTHLITDLDVGGAETTLCKLVSRIDRVRFESRVISMLPPGPLADRLENANIPVATLGMRRGSVDPRALLRLEREIRKWQPHILQTWMYHADLFGTVIRLTHPSIALVWNIRHAELNPGQHKASTLAVARLCAALSRLVPKRIVCCSESARAAHVSLGYDASKITCIANGFDLDQFRPVPGARESVGCELAIPLGAPIVVSAARFHPDKNHKGLLEAAVRVIAVRPDCVFVMCGDGVTWENPELTALIETAGCRHHVRLLGRRSDLPRLMSSATAFTNTSLSESFPNVLGEAMACGCCCVATDVGASSSILGTAGVVVPAADPAALAESILRILNMDAKEQSQTGCLARERVAELFNLPDVTARYEQLYSELAWT